MHLTIPQLSLKAKPARQDLLSRWFANCVYIYGGEALTLSNNVIHCFRQNGQSRWVVSSYPHMPIDHPD